MVGCRVTAFDQLFHISHRGFRPSKLFSFAQCFAFRTSKVSPLPFRRVFRHVLRPIVSRLGTATGRLNSQPELTRLNVYNKRCVWCFSIVVYHPSGLIVSNAVEILHAFMGAGHRFAFCRHTLEIAAGTQVFFFNAVRVLILLWSPSAKLYMDLQTVKCLPPMGQ